MRHRRHLPLTGAQEEGTRTLQNQASAAAKGSTLPTQFKLIDGFRAQLVAVSGEIYAQLRDLKYHTQVKRINKYVSRQKLLFCDGFSQC